MKIYI